mmetsp:Transcript_1369/g.2211  ORF Transcript_1369/g.2211 Transcript_1369/m.2211 type:complete len:85 (+) Transcript_1369:576-830(+)
MIFKIPLSVVIVFCEEDILCLSIKQSWPCASMGGKKGNTSNRRDQFMKVFIVCALLPAVVVLCRSRSQLANSRLKFSNEEVEAA